MGCGRVADIRIKGLKPLLIHAFGPEILSATKTKKEKCGVAGNDPSEWLRTVLYKPNKQLYFPPEYAFALVRDGAKYTKRGRGSIQPLVAATLIVTSEEMLFDRFLPDDIYCLTNNRNSPVYLDVRAVNNPTTRKRNIRYRVALSPGWSTQFRISWDASIVSQQEMEASIIDAGKFVGLGDGRAVGFGRFELEQMDMLESDA